MAAAAAEADPTYAMSKTLKPGKSHGHGTCLEVLLVCQEHNVRVSGLTNEDLKGLLTKVELPVRGNKQVQLETLAKAKNADEELAKLRPDGVEVTTPSPEDDCDFKWLPVGWTFYKKTSTSRPKTAKKKKEHKELKLPLIIVKAPLTDRFKKKIVGYIALQDQEDKGEHGSAVARKDLSPTPSTSVAVMSEAAKAAVELVDAATSMSFVHTFIEPLRDAGFAASAIPSLVELEMHYDESDTAHDVAQAIITKRFETLPPAINGVDVFLALGFVNHISRRLLVRYTAEENETCWDVAGRYLEEVMFDPQEPMDPPDLAPMSTDQTKNVICELALGSDHKGLPTQIQTCFFSRGVSRDAADFKALWAEISQNLAQVGATLYFHGTTTTELFSFRRYGVDFRSVRSNRDFNVRSNGFYMTADAVQAWAWANLRATRHRAREQNTEQPNDSGAWPALIAFRIDNDRRDTLISAKYTEPQQVPANFPPTDVALINHCRGQARWASWPRAVPLPSGPQPCETVHWIEGRYWCHGNTYKGHQVCVVEAVHAGEREMEARELLNASMCGWFISPPF